MLKPYHRNTIGGCFSLNEMLTLLKVDVDDPLQFILSIEDSFELVEREDYDVVPTFLEYTPPTVYVTPLAGVIICNRLPKTVESIIVKFWLFDVAAKYEK